jgi:hypothetical protein
MPRLRYTPELFGRYMGAAFARPAEIVFSWDELCRSAITVGRRRWSDVSQFGTYSVLESMWRVGMIRANLVEEANGRLRKSGAFVNLDPSEKSAVSYFLGVTLAKLITERLFGVAWLLHLDVYRQFLNPTLALSNKPDFVGLNSAAHWVVIESKGRTNLANSKLVDAAKRQTRSLRQVGGQMPALRAAIVIDFAYGSLRARVRDPDDFDPDAPDVPIEAPQLVRAYYHPLVQLIQRLPHERRQDSATGQFYVRTTLPLLDVTVELNEKIFEWYESSDAPLSEIERTLPQPLQVLQQRVEHWDLNAEDQKNVADSGTRREILDLSLLRREQAIGADGVSVTLGDSWTTEMMRREPEHRG